MEHLGTRGRMPCKRNSVSPSKIYMPLWTISRTLQVSIFFSFLQFCLVLEARTHDTAQNKEFAKVTFQGKKALCT